MNTIVFLIILVVACLVCGAVSGEIADKKGRSYGAYFALGFFLNVIGILCAVGVPETLELKIEQAISISEAIEAHKQEKEMAAQKAAAQTE